MQLLARRDGICTARTPGNDQAYLVALAARWSPSSNSASPSAITPSRGLRNMAETKFSVSIQWSTASGEWAGFLSPEKRRGTCTIDIRAVATTFSWHGENPRLADTVSIRL